MLTPRPVLLLALVAPAVALAGCGSSPQTGSADQRATAPASASASVSAAASAPKDCAAVPAARVDAALGIDVGEPIRTGEGAVTVCSYDGDPTHAIIRFETDVDSLDPARRQARETGQQPRDLPGVGDEAFSSSVGMGAYRITTVTARRGSLEVLVTTRASLDREARLVRALLGQG